MEPDTSVEQLIEEKMSQAREYAELQDGFLNRKQLASILVISLATLSGLFDTLPPDRPIIRARTSGGRGGILIPLATALYMIEERFEVC